MERIIVFVIITALWAYGLWFLKKANMNFYRFLIGSIGIFTISMIFFMPVLEINLNNLIADTLRFISDKSNYFKVFKDNSIVTIDTSSGIVSMFINYECSGVIEMLVFTSLVLFFPFGGTFRRIVSAMIGNAFIYFANIIRILFIIFITRFFGASLFYLAHTLFARLVFFGLMIILYYFIFTTTHLRYQNVGEIR